MFSLVAVMKRFEADPCRV